MGLDNREQQLQCPCCKTCKDCTDIQKIVDLKDAGLVIYRHTTRIEDVNKETGLLETATNTTEDVFILHNTKDVEITSADFVPTLESSKTSCPRCRNIIEHAQKLLQRVPILDKKDIRGVCDHCRRKERSHGPCNECEEIIKKFVTNKSDRSEETKQRVKLWLSKIKNLLQDVRSEEEGNTRKEKSRTHADVNIKKLCLTTPKPIREPVVKQLFHLDSQRSDVTETPPKSIEDIGQKYDVKAYQSYLQKLDKSVVFVDSDKYPEKISSVLEGSTTKKDISHMSDDSEAIFDAKDYKDRLRHENIKLDEGGTRMPPSKDFNEESQRRKQLPNFDSSNLMKSEKWSSSPSKQTSGKIMSAFEKPNSYLKRVGKPDKSTLDRELSTKKSVLFLSPSLVPTASLSEDSRLDIPFQDISKVDLEKKQPFSLVQGHQNKSSQQLFEFERTKTARPKKGSEKRLESSNRIKKYRSEEALLTSVVGVTDDFLKKDFSYFFPKEIKESKHPKRLVSSAELIRDTQDMLLARAEEEKTRFEEARKRKLEEDERIRIGREEKKKMAEEKRKAEEERKHKEEQERRRDEEKIRRSDEEIRRDEEERRRDEAEKNDEGRKKGAEVLKNDAQKYLTVEDDKSKKREEKKLKPEKTKKSVPSTTDSTVKSRSEKIKDTKLNEKSDKKSSKTDKDAETSSKEKDKKPIEEMSKKQGEDILKEKKEKHRIKKEKEDLSHKDRDQKQANTDKEILEQQNKKETDNRNSEKEESKDKEPKSKANMPDDQLKNLLALKAKDKEADLKRKKQDEHSEKLARDLAETKMKPNEDIKSKSGRDAKAETKSEIPEKPIPHIKTEIPTIKELNINQIKIRKASTDDLILQLVKLKQSEPHTERIRPNRLSELNLSPVIIEEHKEHKNKKESTCIMCIDSDLELDVESIVFKADKSLEMADIIIGPKIFRYKPPLLQKKEYDEIVPLKFQSVFNAEAPINKQREIVEIIPEVPERKPPPLLAAKSAKSTDQEAPKGIVRYALSDRSFIDKGWTMLPTEKVVRKMNVYRMRPAHPEFDWFEHNKNKRLILYDTGEKLAEFEDNGRGRWYYRNGRLALDYYDAEESNAQQRFVVYSSGEPDERGRTHPITILATFDYLGNGIVFDHGGKIRLKYNQTEGVVLDRGIGPVSHWKWHTLNDPPVLQQVMIDTQMSHKDPEIFKMGGPSDNKTRPDNEEMLAIEFDNFIKEKSKKLSQTFKPFQIKMKALKINEHFSLKILDQATVYLIYRDGTTNLKLNIGMILDHKEIVDTDTAELGEVSNNLERFPARTESLAGLQRSVAYAQRFERSRIERERRLHPAEPCASADQLTAAVSRPLRPPLRSVPSGSTATGRDCYCKCSRKPSSSNLYYDTRLI